MTDLKSRGFHLLALAKTIRHYERALTEARGERFNIFDIIHVGHYEVRTHSPILAELLSPKGSHGQGATFLKLFLAELKIQEFDAESARVATEVSIGVLGRVDIEITDRHKRRIVVENKIYAGLGFQQLERYRQEYPKAHLLYLTLNGDKPPNGMDGTVRSISYRCDILRWLESCRKEVATAPCVREAITQYIHLIQRLTNQNTSARMNQEIINAVIQDKSGDTYLAYASLRNENWNIRKAIIDKVNAQLAALGKELGLTTFEVFAGESKAAENWFYTTPTLAAQNLRFGLRCSQSEYRGVHFGFAYINTNLKSPLDSLVAALFTDTFGEPRSNPFWSAYAFWDHHLNWDDDTLATIISGEFTPDLDALIRKLTNIADEACKAAAAATK